MPVATIEDEARYLAVENRKADPDIQRAYWFPADGEVRLVELTDLVPVSSDAKLHPVYFRSDPEDSLPFASAVALIRPEEFGKLRLPAQWGKWEDAVVLDDQE